MNAMNPINTQTIRYRLADGIATLTFDEQGSPVNTMSAQWQDDMARITAQVVQDRAQIRGVVLASAKSTFFAGADLRAVMRLRPSDGPQVFQAVERMKQQFRTLETLGVPVVACLNGSALGGGWELALVGHHRIALNQPSVRFGLPEVTLGLIPGGGGITKMTRLLGLQAAQPYLLEGRLFNPEQALKLGLVHALVDTPDALLPQALALIEAQQHQPEACQPWDRKGYTLPGGTPQQPQLAGLLSMAPALLKRSTQGRYPAPEAALAAMVEGALVDVDTALRLESRYLATVMVGPVARNMVNTFFFNLNAIQHRPGPAAGTASNSLPARPAQLPGLPKVPNPSVQALLDALHPTVTRRLQHSVAQETAALLSEGLPAALVNNAGLQAAMALGPLVLLAACGLDTTLSGQQALSPEQAQKVWDVQPIQDRLLYRQAVEAARCLHEGVVSQVAEGNIASIFGVGFPGWTGGALQFIYSMGVPQFAQRCTRLASQHGPGFVLDEAVQATLHQHQPVY
ncbi:MAG: Fatty acid oxidation complex subunit alpha [Pseudomonadota bacterium]|jgi:enoyl-CoA hydratase/carnithine racemase